MEENNGAWSKDKSDLAAMMGAEIARRLLESDPVLRAYKTKLAVAIAAQHETNGMILQRIAHLTGWELGHEVDHVADRIMNEAVTESDEFNSSPERPI